MQHSNPVIDVQLLDALETRLGCLAARWRGTQDGEYANAIVRQYQAILLWMLELGHEGNLDVDAELPNEHLPTEYLALRRK